MRFGIKGVVLAAGVAASACAMCVADVQTVVTTDGNVLAAALRPQGLTIQSVTVLKGQPGQVGTYTGFTSPPVTIRSGIVLSSGSVADLRPLLEAQDPLYDPASPPARVNSWMDTVGDGGTQEFDDYGVLHNNIHGFNQSFDVASVEVVFTLDQDSQVQFDFIFGTVEYPIYTNQFTDAFIVFLDGLTENEQITYDANGKAVQVGSSFAGLETSADTNTAFAQPHGLIHHLTTTTALIESGTHWMRFEVGDVNDHILDSAAFITGLRVGAGTPGTGSSDDCRADYNGNGTVGVQDLFDFLAGWFDHETDADFDGSGAWGPQDIFDFLAAWFTGCA